MKEAPIYDVGTIVLLGKREATVVLSNPSRLRVRMTEPKTSTFIAADGKEVVIHRKVEKDISPYAELEVLQEKPDATQATSQEEAAHVQGDADNPLEQGGEGHDQR